MTTKINKPLPTIIIDTREQRPYQFSQHKDPSVFNPDQRDESRLNIIHRKLDAGDYSLDGLEYQIAIERKELNDLIDTIIIDKSRFKIELDKLKNYDFAAILVEGSIQDILGCEYTAQIAPQAIIAAINSIMIIYGIPVIFAGNRMAAKIVCEDLLLRYWEREQEKEKLIEPTNKKRGRKLKQIPNPEMAAELSLPLPEKKKED